MPHHTPADSVIPQLFDAHAGAIYSLGLRMCPNTDEAQDLVQETFMRAWTSWDQFEGRSSPSTWLWTIAVRACQRMKRKRVGEPDRLEPLESLLPSADATIPDIAGPDGPDVLDEVIRHEIQESVERAIGELPQDFRLAVVLKEIAGLSLSEIADILDVKEATVKTRVHRARLLLRNALAADLPQREAPHPDHSREVCLDLLHSKQEAMDRGVPFPVPEAELCERCSSMFSTLDLARDACVNIAHGELPEPVAALMRKRFGGAGQ
jgi:RNA polymerase sigma-70 factor (ECF subfamily)